MIILDRPLLHAVIDDMPEEELNVVYKMFSSFIDDYRDRHFTQEEMAQHLQALKDDEWY